MHIVFFEAEGWEPDLVKSLNVDHKVEFTPDPLDLSNAHSFKNADIISPFIHSSLGRSVLEGFEQLKFIATRSTGFDHIDLEYCDENSIAVSNVPVYGSNTVAEHTFALLLAISHHIPKAVSGTRRGDFSGAGLRGFDLHGKKFGVIGTGHIGKRVVEIANGFGMQVLAFDVEPDTEFAQRNNMSYVALETLLQEADCISLHVPGGESTRHMLSDSQFAKMKKNAVVINTARGTIIDTGALLRALNDKTVAAAALDVLPEESAMKAASATKREPDPDKQDLGTLRANHELIRLENVIVTPHSAFNTIEAVERILQTTLENIESFIVGNPQNIVVK